jgi:TonB family protein
MAKMLKPAISAILITLLPTLARAQASPSPDTPPTATGPHWCKMFYPPEAIAHGEEGVAVLTFHVGQDGRVKDVVLSKSSGFDVLDKAAMTCVSTWTYNPATHDGQPLEVSWSANVEWFLDFQPMPIGYHDCGSEARQMPNEHAAEVQFTIGVDGHVKDVRLSQSSGNQTLDQALIGCIQDWQYRPGRNHEHMAEFQKRMPLSALEKSVRD